METIYAPATARGRAGIAVLRISGVRASEAAAALNAELPAPRRAALRRLATAELGVLDEALVLYFEPGASFTGEAVVEFHIHGSPAVMQAILSVLGRLEGFRLAEPGEFTRRALENERMDLAQVEGLGDLIQAETESQRRQAQRALSGALGARAEEWRELLTRAAALLTAMIDFADEDVPVDVAPEVLERIDRVMVALETEIAGARAAERVREGFEVAVVGPPNVGKSTLLNALAGREAAITSSVAGTTRDVIEVQMDLAGLSVTLLDTAGLRETADVVEGMGVERALKRARAADLRVILSESDELPFGVTPEGGDIRVAAKADLGTCAEGLAVSGLSGEGIGALVDRIAQVCEDRASGAATITRERHVQAIGRALASLASAREHAAAVAMQAEFAADDLRGACRALDSLVGRVDVEHILDDVFASFCIGK